MPDPVFPKDDFVAKIISVSQHSDGQLFMTLIPEAIRGQPGPLSERETFFLDQSNHSGMLAVVLAAYLNNLPVRVQVNPKAQASPGGYRVLYVVEIRQEAAYSDYLVSPVIANIANIADVPNIPDIPGNLRAKQPRPVKPTTKRIG